MKKIKRLAQHDDFEIEKKTEEHNNEFLIPSQVVKQIKQFNQPQTIKLNY